MRATFVAGLFLSLAFAGCIDGEGGFAGFFGAEEPEQETLVLLQTLAEFPEWRMEVDGREDIRTILYTQWLPTTTDHIISITQRDFYDRTYMHRVVDDFVIQGGDSTCQRTAQGTQCTGDGGSGDGGTSQNIPLEIHPGLDFGTGAIGMARYTNDTGDSQYFITEKPALHLSRPERSATGPAFGAYSLFAQVFEGHDTVRAIAAVPVDANDQPIEDVIVVDINVLPPPLDADLLNLIPDVHPDLSTQGYQGTLETSRILVTEHATTIRFTTNTPQSDDGPIAGLPISDPTNGTVPNGTVPDDGDQEPVADCDIMDFVLQYPDGTRTALPWTKNAVDPCTYEHSIVFDEAGDYVIDLGVDDIDITVLPWHDDYAPYTGNPIDDA